MTGAVLTGAIVGMILHFTGSTISQALHIEWPDEIPRRRTRRKSIQSTPEDPPFNYLETKEDTKDFPWSTILEEEESSHESE